MDSLGMDGVVLPRTPAQQGYNGYRNSRGKALWIFVQLRLQFEKFSGFRSFGTRAGTLH